MILHTQTSEKNRIQPPTWNNFHLHSSKTWKGSFLISIWNIKIRVCCNTGLNFGTYANAATMMVCGQQFQISVHLFSLYFITFLLCSCYQAQLCGVERRTGCSGPSAEMMLFKVGFVQRSRAPLCPGTPSSSPWLNLQLLHCISQPGVVILESFRVNSEILWQLLTALCCLGWVMMKNAVKRWHSSWPEMPLRSHRSVSPVGSQSCRSHGCVESSYWIHESQ